MRVAPKPSQLARIRLSPATRTGVPERERATEVSVTWNLTSQSSYLPLGALCPLAQRTACHTRADSFNLLNGTFHLQGPLMHWVYLSIDVLLLSDVYLSLGLKKNSKTYFWFQSKLSINCLAHFSLA